VYNGHKTISRLFNFPCHD